MMNPLYRGESTIPLGTMTTNEIIREENASPSRINEAAFTDNRPSDRMNSRR